MRTQLGSGNDGFSLERINLLWILEAIRYREPMRDNKGVGKGCAHRACRTRHLLRLQYRRGTSRGICP